MRGRRRFLILLPAMFLANPLSAQSVWTIPGTANASGQNNTRFVSDLTATNPGTSAVDVAISFFPASTPNTKNVTLNAGETVVYRNVVDSLFGAGGAGALSISSDQPLLLRARTYNTASSGTYGVALPVYEAERFLTAGEVGDTVWVSQDASASSGYRTNIAVVFPDETGGAATVTVYDADGNERGHKDYGLDTAGFQQFAVGSFAGAVSVGRAQIHVTRGRAAGYAAVVDNVTGDSSLFTFEDLPGGRQDVLINGVARANGKNGTFFRTDGRFFNPTDTDATVRVAFHANGTANPSPVTASFILPAGKIRDVVDVLDTLLSLPVGSSGALRFRSDWPVAILCRTSNVDPSGAVPGTFGAQQKPVPLLSFLTSADAGALIAGVRQNAAYRTNVALAAGSDGATAQYTLRTAGGASAGTATQTLGPNGWVQTAADKLFAGTIPDDAQILVKITQGSADVFDSSVDNASGDSVVTPAQALPVEIASSATIGPAGGSIRSGDGRLTLRIPAGALSSPISLSFQTTTNDAPQGKGPGYQLSPAGVAFARPALMTLAYALADTEGSSAEALTLAVTSGSGWYAAGGGALDSARHTMTVPIASTAPALSTAPASRAPLASGATYWAVVQSWELFPAGKRAVLTDGRLEFVVRAIPEGSSSTNVFGMQLISSTLADVEITWYVNGVVLGDPVNGVIEPSGNIGVYRAPRCPPQRNPATIYATIKNRSGFPFAPYKVQGSAWVRVLPKEWTFTVIQDSNFTCPDALAADHAKWTAGFSFTLDDKLNATRPAPAPQVVEYFGNPSSCEPYEVDFKRSGDPMLDATLHEGYYDAELDAFRLFIDMLLPTSLGYDYNTVGNDGKKYPSHIDPGPVVSVPDAELPIPETRFTMIVPTAAGAFGLTIELKHVASGGCP